MPVKREVIVIKFVQNYSFTLLDDLPEYRSVPLFALIGAHNPILI